MIKLMLRNPMEHVIEVVTFAWDAITEARVRQSGDGLHQSFVRTFRFGDGLAPSSFARHLREREVRHTGWLTFFSAQSLESRGIPNRNMQYKFPNAVNLRQRLGGGRCSVDLLQQFEQSRSVPRAAVESAAKLVSDSRGLGMCSRVFRHHRMKP